jgi:Fic family protein
MQLMIFNIALLPEYLSSVPTGIKNSFESLHDAELSTTTFSFYTSVSSVYSSKIEGETIELDSYVKHKRFGIEFQPDYTRKIDDLYNAYLFAQSNELNERTIAEMHKLLAKHLVSDAYLGKFRAHNMYVSTEDGRIEYVAASPYEVAQEMAKFYNDLDVLLKTPMTIEEIFFYAAMAHLIFVKIHPWNDGNGRSARLIEKWFLAQKLGEKAWFLQSEKHYYKNHQLYYRNLRLPGLEYQELDYTKALPFLLMLPNSL